MTFDTMTRGELAERGISIRSYAIDGTDIRVEWRAAFLWSVCHGRSCLNSDGEWEYEMNPSNRTDEFKARCRFGLDDCLRMALEVRVRDNEEKTKQAERLAQQLPQI